MLLRYIVLLILSLLFIHTVVEDVENRIPFTLLLLQTLGLVIAAFLDGERENDDRWVYAAGLAYVFVAFVYILSNYLLQ